MSMTVNTNIAAMGSLNALENTTSALNTSIEQLSTGLKINGAGDNPSGEAISQTMTAQINGLNTAQQNAQDGLSALQTADGGLNTVDSILQNINTLSVSAANTATLTSGDVSLIQSQVTQLTSELDRMASTVAFNGKNLLDGSYTGESLQVSNGSQGGGATDPNQISISVSAVTSAALGLSGINLTTAAGAASAITLVTSAINQVSNQRGALGAVMDRLNYTVSNLGSEVQNATASLSTLQDVDMASAMSNYTKLQILQQSGTAMLAQANQAPSAVLKLLG
jgi:flagellin